MSADIPTDPPLSAAPQEILPGLLMQVAARLAQDLCADASRTASLKPPFLGVLALIRANPGIRQGLCASALGFDATTFGRYVDRMVREGLVCRTVPTEDRRAVCLRLTLEGERVMSESSRMVETLQESLRERMGESEWDRLTRLLERFLAVHDHPLPILLREERLTVETIIEG